VQRHLPAGVPGLDTEVVAVDGLELPPGDEPDPQVERDPRVVQVVGQAPGDLEVCLLEDVGRIDPALEPAVEAELDHPPQPRAVLGERRRKRGRVPGAGAAEHLRLGLPVAGHERPHWAVIARRRDQSTGNPPLRTSVDRG
jgi:hypothetical protein